TTCSPRSWASSTPCGSSQRTRSVAYTARSTVAIAQPPMPTSARSRHVQCRLNGESAAPAASRAALELAIAVTVPAAPPSPKPAARRRGLGVLRRQVELTELELVKLAVFAAARHQLVV